MKSYRICIALCLAFFVVFAHSADQPKIEIKEGARIQPYNFYPRVKLETSLGDIIIELRRNRAPITVNNFLMYVKEKQYDNTLFHRVIEDYIVQGGGFSTSMESLPAKYKIFNESGNGLKNIRYSLAMARMNDPHSANRQFFFNVNDNDNLDPNKRWGYTVFAEVIEGFDVVDAMAAVETHLDPVSGLEDKPVQDLVLIKASILPQEE